ncbi:MAG: response regulator [Candidatus Omnitrophica bacterium]|nr:response regulator [Candidatus Omnitrophota bacterium]
MESDEQVVDILIAEDTLDDIVITKRAFKNARLANRLFVVRDGQEAIDFLTHQGEYTDKDKYPRPGLILLDINMPRLNGIEVLKKIKETDELKKIPVIMLTVSRRDEDIVKSYDYGCNSFLQKPVDYDNFADLVAQIGFYWGLLNVNIPK